MDQRNDRDFKAFSELLDATCALLTRGQYTPNPASTAIFFRALSAYPLDSVRRAFGSHAATSRFSPTPADILDILRESDGRPEEDEAWAIAIAAADETATVVWTGEISAAWAVCQTVLQAGDEVGARMAFKAAYRRMVVDARAARQPMSWSASLGSDPEKRRCALQLAAASGRDTGLTADQSSVLRIEAPAGGVAGLLTHCVDAARVSSTCPPAVLERLVEMREEELLKRSAKESELGRDGAAKARTAALRQLAADKVANHNEGNNE